MISWQTERVVASWEARPEQQRGILSSIDWLPGNIPATIFI
jgi:hypothetical protein